MVLNNAQEQLMLAHAFLYLQYKQADKAKVLLNALLELNPDSHQAQQCMAVVALQVGDVERAISLCETLLNNTDDAQERAQVFLCLSRALWRHGDEDGARSAHEHYVDHLSPGSEVDE